MARKWPANKKVVCVKCVYILQKQQLADHDKMSGSLADETRSHCRGENHRGGDRAVQQSVWTHGIQERSLDPHVWTGYEPTRALCHFAGFLMFAFSSGECVFGHFKQYRGWLEGMTTKFNLPSRSLHLIIHRIGFR